MFYQYNDLVFYSCLFKFRVTDRALNVILSRPMDVKRHFVRRTMLCGPYGPATQKGGGEGGEGGRHPWWNYSWRNAVFSQPYTVPRIRLMYSQNETAQPRSQFLHSLGNLQWSVVGNLQGSGVGNHIPRIGLPICTVQTLNLILLCKRCIPQMHFWIASKIYLHLLPCLESNVTKQGNLAPTLK